MRRGKKRGEKRAFHSQMCIMRREKRVVSQRTQNEKHIKNQTCARNAKQTSQKLQQRRLPDAISQRVSFPVHVHARGGDDDVSAFVIHIIFSFFSLVTDVRLPKVVTRVFPKISHSFRVFSNLTKKPATGSLFLYSLTHSSSRPNRCIK